MLKSVGQITRELRCERHQVVYIVGSRNVPSVGKVGSSNAYDEAAVGRIKTALEEIGQGKEAAPAAGAGL